jgi:NADH-quinone oxidoreductase subunit J
MTLFLFVVMTLSMDNEALQEGFVRYLPYGVIIVGLLVALMIYVLLPIHSGPLTANLMPVQQAADYSNVKALGDVLYTNYVYPFEIAGVLLLVAIIAAISLAFRGRQNNKNMAPEHQINVRSQDRIRIIQMKSVGRE